MLLALTTLLLPALATSLPTTPSNQTNMNPTNFYLVTTTQCTTTTNSSLLANVSATSVFDPYEMPTYSIRLIAPGYGSLPTFNLTNGDLVTLQNEPMNEGQALYNSTGPIVPGQKLQLAPTMEPAGNLRLKDGYLVTVDGEEVGWTVCEGDLEESVIYWKGNDSSCNPTYVHAVSSPPY